MQEKQPGSTAVHASQTAVRQAARLAECVQCRAHYTCGEHAQEFPVQQ